MDSGDSRQTQYRDFAALGAKAIEHSWRLLADCARFSSAFAAKENEDPQHLLEEAKQHFDAVLEQLRQQQHPLIALLHMLNNGDQATNPLQGLFAPGVIPPFALPYLGPLQHNQQKTADANKAAQEYLAAQQDYLALLQQLGERVLAAGKTRLEQDPKPAGIQEVYSAWLEATESVYEEYVFSEEYTRSLGRLSHATARLIRHTQDSLEGVLKLLGLPTRTDMLSTQRRLHEIRRQQHACAEHVAADEFLALKNEVQALRQELQNLKRAQADNEEHE
ncbi:hypothetical protein CAI21_01690 [Alkalilimnicola ehrlichii]|uniref:poly(R)-hydroxyalkanoic acid synthase subunit PhaE n=1 Tax=Alkalilimnicola ehrlichii TaxID=351052 RepID=UPI000E2FD042|nr:poly(R)-hydroxyalkanoic acid synthase subunit PhaE [Alkalilimnicola ehrlichii]RFA31361.1 hypothetical protein CAI21_01690 [Alkalilimnicola ehrlichii]